MQNLIRINKFIATAGVCSRRMADKIIEEKRVTVNGKIAECGTVVDIEKDIVELDGKKVTINNKKVYYMLNKPKKILTSVKDDRNRKTVLDIVKVKERIFPVGRLDYDTEGLLILTNDGELYNRIIHPRSEVYKTYIAIIDGKLKEEEKRKLEEGIYLQDGKTLPAIVKILEIKENKSKIEISIREGRNRQVRRMFEYFGYSVLELKRIAIGDIRLGKLKAGNYRSLTESEINYLYSL